MSNYIEVSRSDADGKYIVDKKQLATMIDSEFDDLEYDLPGTVVFLRIITMSEKNFKALPEFEGW